MIYLYLFGTCFHFIYVFMIIGNNPPLLYVTSNYSNNDRRRILIWYGYPKTFLAVF
ncbi:hypothetical protein HMPREF1064_02957 [Phocaeicola dorei CL02T12C06]|uniref:Uncharacterized protein n=1 Tax=Phocaeicola dorei CL02T12C06 TaxID=997876 RepID=I9FGE2_9BACT|nr:hypothetical protein HMPREF1064_02957 [Phocaeicola dorei CL02T12C06]